MTITGLTATDSVWLYVDGAIDQRDIATSGTLSFTTSTLNDNTHELKIKAKDYAGNVSDFSNSLNIRVDTTPFTITTIPDLLADDDTGISNTDNIQSDWDGTYMRIASGDNTNDSETPTTGELMLFNVLSVDKMHNTSKAILTHPTRREQIR